MRKIKKKVRAIWIRFKSTGLSKGDKTVPNLRNARNNNTDNGDLIFPIARDNWKMTDRYSVRDAEEELDQLIVGCSRRMAAYLQLLKETGMRPGEVIVWNGLI